MSAITKEERLEINKKTYKPLIWLGILSIVMLFAGFSSGYIVSQTDSLWVKITLPEAFYTSNYYIIGSSVTFFLATLFMKKNKRMFSNLFIFSTLILGILFVKSQYEGYLELNKKGNYFTFGNIDKVIKNGKYGVDYVLYQNEIELVMKDGYFYDPADRGFLKPLNEELDFEKSNRSASWLVALCGIHVIHLLGGLLSLIFVFIKTLRNKYSSENYIGMQVSSIYWHFLDFLWLYLFVFLTFF